MFDLYPLLQPVTTSAVFCSMKQIEFRKKESIKHTKIKRKPEAFLLQFSNFFRTQ